MKQPRKLIATMLVLVSFGSSAVEPEDAAAIMEKVYQTPRVADQISTLSFTFNRPGEKARRAVYVMVWKDMKRKDGYDNKAIFYTEFPLARKGIAYLGWLHPIGSEQKNDEWIYLPELAMTRRIVPRDHERANDEDEFFGSLLTHEHLEPRPPHLDDHRLLDEKTFNDEVHYLIDSRPAHHSHGGSHAHGNGDSPARRVSWVDKKEMRINRIQFFGDDDKMQLDMQIEWLQQDGYWLWQRVEAVDPSSEARTVLDISDIRINSGLKERQFHKRNLDKGSGRFK